MGKSNTKEARRKKRHRINWHHAACEVLKIELEEYLDTLEFYEEYHLGKSKDALRSDILVIKKLSELQISKQIATIFQTYNLIEYKSPADNLSIDDYYKLIGCGCIFRSITGKVNEVENRDITLTFLVSKFPVKLEKELKKRQIPLAKRAPGIYDIDREIFRIQLIVNRKLDARENLWLRCLDSELKEKSLYEGLERSYARHKNEERYSAPMNAIVWSNYERKGESGIMCEALYDLFADELEERMERGKAEGRAEGKAEGKAEGRVEAILDLLEDLGECPVQLKAAIMREKDIEVLRAWNKIAAKSESIAEFEEKSGVLEKV